LNKISKRIVAGKGWSDPSLADSLENDFSLLFGNLSKDTDTTDTKFAEKLFFETIFSYDTGNLQKSCSKIEGICVCKFNGSQL